MAKTFYLDRETDPSNPTLESANNELIKNYETISDMEGDLTNVDDGEVISTEEADYTSVHISDEVTDGDLNPVTSNAVYDAIEAAKIDRVKGAFVEERTNKLWTDGRPIYRIYVEGTPAYVDSGNRRSFNLDIPMGTSDSYCPLSYEGYIEIVQNTSYPQLVGAKYTLCSTSMTPTTPWSSAMTCILQADARYLNKLVLGLAVNNAMTYGMSEHIKICAVIEYTKMSDEPVSTSGSGLTHSSENVAGIIVRPGMSYSTTEVPTGDTWIDGKPIYRKAFNGYYTTYTDSGIRRLFSTDVYVSDIDTIVSQGGSVCFYTNPADNKAQWVNFGSTWADVDLNAVYSSNFIKSDTTARLYGATKIDPVLTRFTYKVFLEYTKA